MNSDDQNVKCPKLSPGSDWENFADKFDNLLTIKGKGTALTKRLKAPLVPAEGAAAPTTEQEDKDANDDAYVSALLGMHVDEAYAPLLRQHRNVPHMQWTALEKAFELQTIAAGAAHEEAWTNLRLQPGEKIWALYARLCTLRTKREKSGDVTSEAAAVKRFTIALGDDYSSIAEAMPLQGTTVLDMVTRCQHKEEELERKRGNKEQEIAMMAGQTGGRRGGRSGGSHGRGPYPGRSHGRDGGSRHQGQQSSRRDRSNDVCNNCGKKGHWAEDCQKGRKERDHIAYVMSVFPTVAAAPTAVPTPPLPLDCSCGSSSCHSPTHVHAAVGSKQQSPGNKSFLVDSAAGAHLISGEVANPQQLHTPREFLTAGGNTITSSAVGNVSLGNDLTVSEVYQVSGLPENLLSVRKLDVRGYSIVFKDSMCTIKAPDGKKWNAPYNGKGYELQGATSVAAMLTEGPKVDALTVHRRMAHISHNSLFRMAKHSMVTGLDISPEQFKQLHDTQCRPCALSKQQALPYHPSGKEYGVMELVVSDVFGPIHPAAPGGLEYVVTLLDICSQASMTRSMRTKGEASTAVESMIRTMLKKAGKDLSTVKKVRTDGGGEYESLGRWCSKHGIEHQTTVPHTPQQNGSAEALGKALVNGARALLVDSGLPM